MHHRYHHHRTTYAQRKATQARRNAGQGLALLALALGLLACLPYLPHMWDMGMAYVLALPWPLALGLPSAVCALLATVCCR